VPHRKLTPDIAIGHEANIIVFISRVPPEEATIADIAREISHTALAEKRKAGLLQIIWPRPGVKLDNVGDTSKRIDKMLREQLPHLAAVAIVLRDKGFFAATMRAVINGMLLTRGIPIPSKIFGDHTDAGAFVCKHAERPPGATELDALISAMDASLG
jgi:hypothetical protein